MGSANSKINCNTSHKKILITGKNSFIGLSFETWLSQPKYIGKYIIDTIDTIGDNWKLYDFSSYDIVFHVAGIAHVDLSKMKNESEQLYYKVNRDLTIEVASKAKNEGVKQFIFMSSIIVYGDSSYIGKTKKIDKNTIPTPSSIYGDSKLQADIGIHKLNSVDFNVVSVRPPMIYGKGCKGNYPILSKFARTYPVFPNIRNERSMLHIDNLCECIRLIIDNNEKGFFYPQNKEYINTSLLVKEIGNVHDKTIILTKIFNPIIYLLATRLKVVNKIFGSLVYEKEISNYMNFSYCVNEFKDSVKLTELNN